MKSYVVVTHVRVECISVLESVTVLFPYWWLSGLMPCGLVGGCQHLTMGVADFCEVFISIKLRSITPWKRVVLTLYSRGGHNAAG